ncbi:TetR/AcrR family transcriptional regulator [Nocardiopsis sp. CNR-923]|uniref:TetR/AcrR family transcriptional regulator n=1 Tax=Nocardiopsis sp. CNR-923 TaxID=1904965 RepID=UPI0021CC78D8|nr:TetR/AcrR family transcriptional regulator [Nocardiopsis sp. CNR-923]
MREALVGIAARVLASEGPRALTTRRLAREAGCSTMAVYTNFDGMAGLVRAMVYEGFARLDRHFGRVRPGADPVADVALMGRAYRRNALANPHLYAVMFGAASLAGFSLTDDDRQHGRYTMVGLIESVRRSVEARRFRASDPVMVAHHMWSAVHGIVTLELGAYLVSPYEADDCFETQLSSLMVAPVTGGRPRRAPWPPLGRRSTRCSARPTTGPRTWETPLARRRAATRPRTAAGRSPLPEAR